MSFKDTFRKVLGYHAMAAPVTTGLLGGASQYVFGLPGGLVATGLGSLGAQYAGAAAARGRGKRGSEAKAAGRKALRNAAIGGGVGMLLGGGVQYIKTYAATGSQNAAFGRALGGEAFGGFAQRSLEGIGDMLGVGSSPKVKPPVAAPAPRQTFPGIGMDLAPLGMAPEAPAKSGTSPLMIGVIAVAALAALA